MTEAFTIGIDTGGTFTDSFVAGADGRHWTVKVPTTPHDLTVCFADAVSQCADAVGLDRRRFLAQTAVIRFSSTIGTNTALTHTGPKLGLIVSAGAEEALYGAAEGGAIWQFIPRDMVAGIGQSSGSDGISAVPPDPEEVNRVVRDLLERGARILVVSLAGSTADPENERAVMRIIERSYPRHYVGAVPTLLSTNISTVADDAGRTAAAVVNAYMHKKLATSLYRAEDDLRDSGFLHPLLVVTTDGSVTRVSKTRALSTYQSGPTAGVHGAALMCEAAGVGVALTADVGGTSTDLGLVSAGRPVSRRSVDVGGMEVAQPSVELHSLAVGGGSICRVVDGRVTVGPDSAAATPGPACFGLGGREPTPTDAWLVLGYLDPEFYLGGRRRLNPALARRAIEDRIAGPLGVSVEEAALAVTDAAEAVVAEGIREMARRPLVASALGDRPLSEVSLVAYGGGGGILLPGVGLRLGLANVFLSAQSPVFSAFGVSTYDVQHRYEARTTLDGARALEGVLGGLEAQARRDARGEGFDPDSATLAAMVLDPSGVPLTDERPPAEVPDALAAREVAAGTPVIVSLSATCPVTKPGLPAAEAAPSRDPGVARKAERSILLTGSAVVAPVFDRDLLQAGHEIPGPALVESAGSTYLIPPGTRGRIDRFGTAVIAEEG